MRLITTHRSPSRPSRGHHRRAARVDLDVRGAEQRSTIGVSSLITCCLVTAGVWLSGRLVGRARAQVPRRPWFRPPRRTPQRCERLLQRTMAGPRHEIWKVWPARFAGRALRREVTFNRSC